MLSPCLFNYMKSIYNIQNAMLGRMTHKLELDKEQWTGSKSGKEYVKAVYCHPAYLTYMQSENE